MFESAVKLKEKAPKVKNNGKNRVVCSYRVAVAAGYSIEEKGLLYCNDGTITDISELVLG
ncbi:MAG: hypothetical protein E7495_07085 [Ruminococcus flavefaciens]|jgi:DNA modification methylase|nr:hypothetical protein [Ruminococcus flavefaciens]